MKSKLNQYVWVVLGVLCWQSAISLQAQPCNEPFPPGTGMSGCADAPLFCSLDDLNGYCSSTTNTPPGICPPSFCGSCENNHWLSFVATSEVVSILIAPSNCMGGNGGGMQAQMFQTDDCGAFTPVSDCFSGGVGVVVPFSLTSNVPLTPGVRYYLMLDSWAGATCDYQLEVLQGLGGGSLVPVIDSIAGPLQACTGNGVWYSVPSAYAAAQYDWLVDSLFGTIVSGQGTDSVEIVWTEFGTTQLCVTPSNACETGSPLCVSLTIGGAATTTQVQESVCTPECVTIGGVDYCESGIYTAVLTSQSGCDSVIVLDLTVIETPADPPVLQGDTVGCAGTASFYTVVSGPGDAVYSWTVTGGTKLNSGNSVEIIWAAGATEGSLCVSFANSCGISPISCQEIMILDSPPTPSIEETIDPAADWLRSYTVPAAGSSTSYQWSVPADADILNGQGTSSILVYWFGSAGGDVCVFAENFCGTSDEACTTVLLTSTLEQAAGAPVHARVFPNPATDYVHLSLSQPLQVPATLVLFNALGQYVLSTQIPAGTEQKTVHLHELPAGVYWWSLTHQHEHLAGGKLVVEGS